MADTQSTSQGYTATDANAVGYDASQAGSKGYTPTNWVVDPNQTTSGQMQQILDPNSQLMVQAKAQGNESANARGLVNSTMGISAAQDSMIKAATPIATSTAQTYADASKTNAGADNAAGQFGAAASNTAALTNAAAINDASKFTADATNKVNLTNAAADNAAGQFTAGAANASSLQNSQNATSIANTKANNDTSIANTTANNANVLKNTQLQQEYSVANNTSTQANSAITNYNNNIAAIGQNVSLDAAAKQTLYDNARAALNQQLAAISQIAGGDPTALASLNLGQYFQAPPPPTPPSAPPGSKTTTAPENQTESNFNSAAYLAANPDVGDPNKWSGTPWQHYQMYGQQEGRQAYWNS